jgi:hypothetical protein
MIFGLVSDGYIQCPCTHHLDEYDSQKVETEIHECHNCGTKYYITSHTLTASYHAMMEVAGELSPRNAHLS